ncbi:hypothetical protein LL965_11815 [Xanthomonas cassavae CFBP 4642]|uniref:Bacteriocin n=1 Tax=Xanthomonas cassavae CFBP 4642 TaxID=1219375 RepID=A0ABS8HFH3_9XANT|nr:hypothetical protein [Xanthomonas cassavae]MCC4620740.1 hypothetical protein [Xanthomonas cassavae CFBP 4642]
MRELTVEETFDVDGEGGATTAFLTGAGAGGFAGGLAFGPAGAAGGAIVGGAIGVALYLL